MNSIVEFSYFQGLCLEANINRGTFIWSKLCVYVDTILSSENSTIVNTIISWFQDVDVIDYISKDTFMCMMHYFLQKFIYRAIVNSIYALVK